jgi:hypothetical protein
MPEASLASVLIGLLGFCAAVYGTILARRSIRDTNRIVKAKNEWDRTKDELTLAWAAKDREKDLRLAAEERADELREDLRRGQAEHHAELRMVHELHLEERSKTTAELRKRDQDLRDLRDVVLDQVMDVANDRPPSLPVNKARLTNDSEEDEA